MSEWKEYKLGELTSVITKGTTPSTLGGGFVERGVNFIKSEAVSYNAKIDKSTFVFIDEETQYKLKRSQLKKDDILFSMAGIYLGKNGLVTEDMLPANTNQALAIIRLNQDKASPKFIHYYLRQKSVIDLVNNMSGQSAQPNINFEEIKSIDISLPPLIEQTAIASILSSLDDKIDLLHRQNKTLEQLAETLFRQWFVEEAEESWVVGKLDDIAVFSNGRSRPNEVENGEIPIYGGNGILGFTDQSNYEGLSIIIGRVGAYCGSLYIENKPIWLSDNALIARGKKEDYTFYLFYLLKSMKLNSMAEGSSHPLLTQTLLKSIDICVPPSQKVLDFNKHVIKFWNNIHANITQIRTLT